MPAEPVRAFAPGRVNLIGEHTDYNGGLCLPFAVSSGVTVSVESALGRSLRVRANDLAEEDEFDPAAPARAEGWRAYVRGVVAELGSVEPCRIEISSELPRGAGLGSSAALCVALALALGGDALDRIELARVCARVENDWAGARTGQLDQLAILLAVEGSAMRLDMSSLDARPVRLELAGHRLAILDSGASRDLASGSGYNERREECERARALLARGERLPAPLAARMRHVAAENERVDAACAALAAGDLAELGRLLDASHRSLRDDYEVSTPEVEATVERAKSAGALGARVHGGGFGGGILALFPPGAPQPPGALEVAPGSGARLL